ncbi:uncharacterized protein LOC133175646 [Saccostrea echinata]|uniref:uncharacterized protein LOC133175646 n=1 Tax=Saccostrea echinata TaxID=191078 RepID=UPI002A7F3044|nr:uncharacterized protein LOC133175646 [Saccostrea echinata]
MLCERVLSILLAVTNSIDLCSPQILSGLENEETILLVKQAEDGTSMETFLSDNHYSSPLNTRNISELLKKNYKSMLLKEVYRNPPDTITLRFLNLYGDVLLWIKFENPTLLPGFRFTSNHFTSSHNINQLSNEMLHSSFYWKQVKDRRGIWFAIFEGFDLKTKAEYPKFLFSQSRTTPYKLVTDPFIYSECYNITENVPSNKNVSLQNCHLQCQSKNILHMAIGLNSACHCGQFHRYRLVPRDLCPPCRDFPDLRCPTKQHIFAGYFLQDTDVEASIAHNYKYHEHMITVSQQAKILTVADLKPDPQIPVPPLYIIQRILLVTPTCNMTKLKLDYSPWPNCAHFREITEFSDHSDILPIYCLRLSHTCAIPFTVNISIPIVTGGNYISAQRMLITGRWNPAMDTTIDRNSIQKSSTNSAIKLINGTTTNAPSLSTVTDLLTKIVTGSLTSTKNEFTSQNPNVLLNRTSAAKNGTHNASSFTKIVTHNAPMAAKTVSHNASYVGTRTLATSNIFQSISGKNFKNTRSSPTKTFPVTPSIVRIQIVNSSLSTHGKQNWSNQTQNIKIKAVCVDRRTYMSVNCKPCILYNVNRSAHVTVDIDDLLNKIRDKLLLPKKNLTSYTRRLRSAEDNRQSAAGMGYVGMTVIVCCVLWIMSTDIVNIVTFIVWLIRKHCETDAVLVRLD